MEAGLNALAWVLLTDGQTVRGLLWLAFATCWFLTWSGAALVLLVRDRLIR